MPTDHDLSLELLLDHGLISLVRANPDFVITSSRGKAAADLPVGSNLCEVAAVLVGLEQALRELWVATDERIEISNVAIMRADGRPERLDYVVICDHTSREYLLSITPSLANDDLSIELEQNLRTKLQLETRVAAQAGAIDAMNEVLKRTNADLINFTRMISHDLKAPMRAIRYSAEDIEETLSGTDDPTQIEALTDLRQQSKRLSLMVTDLLTYSRLEDKAAAATTVETHELVKEIAQSLPRPDNLALEIVGEWPQITTIRALLDVVIRNLLDNAIKHHDRGEGMISISAGQGDDNLMIVVSDDGPGIPKDYREAVLRPFVRVKRTPSQGSGMGLSMVQKVVSQVGGRLDIGDRLDGRNGARIAVSWPLTIKAF